jgi:hypothetical protein
MKKSSTARIRSTDSLPTRHFVEVLIGLDMTWGELAYSAAHELRHTQLAIEDSPSTPAPLAIACGYPLVTRSIAAEA